MNKKRNSFYDDVMQLFSLAPPLFFSFLFLQLSVFQTILLSVHIKISLKGRPNSTKNR